MANFGHGGLVDKNFLLSLFYEMTFIPRVSGFLKHISMEVKVNQGETHIYGKEWKGKCRPILQYSGSC